MPSLLTQRRLDRLVSRIKNELFEDIGIRFEFPLEIKLSLFSPTKFMYDRKSGRLKLVINRFEGLREGRIEVLLKYFLLKVLAYKAFCPINEVRASQITISAIKNSDFISGITAATILIEILADFYISHIDLNTLFRGLKFLRKKFLGFGKLSRSVMHTYNLMLGENVFFGIDRKSREIGENMYEIIFARNVMDPSSWPTIAGDLARYIKHVREAIGETSRRHYFIYDYSKELIPSLVVQIGKGGKIIERVLKIFYEKFKGNISSAAPALLSTVASTPGEILRFWYRERAKELVRVIIGSTYVEKRQRVSYPITWEMGDPIEKLDVFLSTSISPVMVPGYTTKKWEIAETSPQIVHRIAPDILIVIDSSGSMSRLPGGVLPEATEEQKLISKRLKIKYVLGSKFDIALTTAFGIVECALNMGSFIGVVNFSDKGYICPFTRDREKIEETMMIHQNGGTYLPVEEILSVLKGKRNVLIIVLSDAAIYNRKEAEYLLRRLSRIHTLYFLHIETEEMKSSILESLRYEGAHIIRIRSLEELPRRALKIVAKHLEYSHEAF